MTTQASTGDTAHDATGWSAAVVVERLGGDEALARELVALFLTEYPRLLQGVHESLASAQADRVRRAAHAAKGCIANFIDGHAEATAYRIERMAAEGHLDDLAPLVAQLGQELAALAAHMRAFEPGAPCGS